MGAIIGLLVRIYTRETGPELYDRHHTILLREREPLLDWLVNEIMYSWPVDVLDRFFPVRRWLKRHSFLSRQSNLKHSSALEIPAFVDFYGIAMGDFVQDNPNTFRNFNDFLIREVRPECRPISALDDDAVITSFADSRVSVFDSLRQARRLFIKDCKFNFHYLLGGRVCHARPDLLHRFNDDSPVANFRLHPADYHRFHAPVSGKIEMLEYIEGEDYNVQSRSLHSHVNVLSENARTVVLLETPENGAVLFVAIGAEDVGSVTMSTEEGADVVKGDEIGMFQFGHSDLLVVFERDVDWDWDLGQWSNKGIETLVRVNERIGTFSVAR